MTVAAILATKGDTVLSIAPDAAIRDAIALLAENRIGALPVLDGDGGVAGILSERDILYGLAKEGAALLDRRVGDVMTSPVAAVTRDTPLLSALAQMTKRRFRHLPVVENGRMVGIVSIGDVVKLRIDRIEAEADAMRSYIAGN